MDLTSLLRLSHFLKLNQCGNIIDLVDQLNYRYTGGILFLLIGIISARQYFGKPIQCWVPVHYSRAWTEYAEDICWAQSTYFLPSNKNVPRNDKDLKSEKHITYYQWVTIFLALQATFSYIPYLLWYIPSRRFSDLLVTLKKANILDKETGKKSIALLTCGIEEHLELNNKKDGILKNHSFTGGTCIFFFISRFICVATCCGQVYSMNVFLGMNDIFFGTTVLKNVIQGCQWESSGHFPRVTICRFEIRNWKPSTVDIETIQCALTINYFFEKMYVFLWFWFVIMIIITVINTTIWICRIYYSYSTQNFIKRYINKSCSSVRINKKNGKKFIKKFLGLDGIFLLVSVSIVVSDLVVFDVINKLWKLFHQLHELKENKENVEISETDQCIV